MKVGILTFYCSDNYGAMLQAYGLKNFVKRVNKDTEIVPYAPFFLIGRHWLIPYCPQKTLGATLKYTCKGLVRNLLRLDAGYFRQRRNMKNFRRKYLCNNLRAIRTVKGIERLPFDTYILGSDQIWNPDITMGLRPAYFGAFSEKKKTIAYAASIGTDRLNRCYQEQMRFLLTFVDRISVREETAVPYIREVTEKPVRAVVDPVFLIEAYEWKKLAIQPKEQKYILVYMTERNQELLKYAEKLSAEKDLPVVELKYEKESCDSHRFKIVTDAGPEEFLGYIFYAEYVLTNSFHVLSFSLIFHKPFMAFTHSTRSARLKSLLSWCGLEARMAINGSIQTNVDAPITWEQVEERLSLQKKQSMAFLEESIQPSNNHE